MTRPVLRGFMSGALIAAAWAAMPAGAAFAAPPPCANITVDDLRQACFERATRCEPLKSAAERDACYRGRVDKTAADKTAADKAAQVQPTVPPQAPAGPIKLLPQREAPVPTPSPAPGPAPSRPSPNALPAPAQAASPPPPPPAPPVVARPVTPSVTPAPASIPRPVVPMVEPVHPTMARPAAPPPVPAPAPLPVPALPPRAGVGDGVEVVRGFFAALTRADGTAANGFLVPEKRGKGAYDVAAMTHYYGNMREPLRLLSADYAGPDLVRARYHYVYASGRVCDGGAEVSLARRDGRPLIERIKALDGC